MTRDDARQLQAGEARFAAYLDGIVTVLGHASRVAPARACCTGLLLPGERKGVEPMAARVEPGRAQAAHQSMRHVAAKCQCRLNSPQKRRLKIPQFVAVQSRPYPRGGSMSASSARSRLTIACNASAVGVSRRASGRASAQAV